jgi:membrane-associated phospholipid phosphatase
MPEWDYVPGKDWGTARRLGGRGAKIGWDFVNDTVSDTWYTASSPVRWRWREWLIVGGAAGVTTGLIFFVDEPLRDAARKSQRFHRYGENVRWVGQGGALLGLTGGFLISGLVLDRPKDLDTVKLMLEASLIGHGYGVAMKYTAGRDRPRTGSGARTFDPFSGNVSMPSGEALNVFLLAGVLTSQYPNWPMRVLAYGMAGAVGAGRIALDAHWGSDIFVSAVIGIAVSKAVVKLNRVRARDRETHRRLELKDAGTPSLRRRKGRHYFGATARSVRWTYVF